MDLRLLVAAQVVVVHPELRVGERIVGPQLRGPQVGLERSIDLAGREKASAQVDPARKELRVVPRPALEVLTRAGVVTAPMVVRADIIERLDVPGVDLDGALEVLERL